MSGKRSRRIDKPQSGKESKREILLPRARLGRKFFENPGSIRRKSTSAKRKKRGTRYRGKGGEVKMWSRPRPSSAGEEAMIAGVKSDEEAKEGAAQERANAEAEPAPFWYAEKNKAPRNCPRARTSLQGSSTLNISCIKVFQEVREGQLQAAGKGDRRARDPATRRLHSRPKAPQPNAERTPIKQKKRIAQLTSERCGCSPRS